LTNFKFDRAGVDGFRFGLWMGNDGITDLVFLKTAPNTSTYLTRNILRVTMAFMESMAHQFKLDIKKLRIWKVSSYAEFTRGYSNAKNAYCNKLKEIDIDNEWVEFLLPLIPKE